MKELLAHINIHVNKPSELRVAAGSPGSIWEQLRGEWWMCPNVKPVTSAAAATAEGGVPEVALISMQPSSSSVAAPSSSNIMAVLGDTYHKFQVARLFSGDLGAMRTFVRANYKFHVEWFEETILAAGLPGHFDRGLVQHHEAMAIYAVTQRLVHELVQKEADRGDEARDAVYGPVWDPMLLSTADDEDGKAIASSVGLLKDDDSSDKKNV